MAKVTRRTLIATRRWDNPMSVSQIMEEEEGAIQVEEEESIQDPAVVGVCVSQVMEAEEGAIQVAAVVRVCQPRWL